MGGNVSAIHTTFAYVKPKETVMEPVPQNPKIEMTPVVGMQVRYFTLRLVVRRWSRDMFF